MKGREYLSFTKKERSGIISLVILLLIIAVIPRFITHTNHVVHNISEEQLEKLRTNNKNRDQSSYYISRDSNHRNYPYYEKRYKKQFFSGSYKRDDRYKKYKSDSTRYTTRSARPEVIEVNTADTSAFIALPGIGSKLASRIVLFREKLGGFYDVQQISEIYGLKDSVFQMILPYLKCDPAHVRKIDINIVDKDVLKIHPYIRWNIASTLVAYRLQHGPFGSMEDVEKIDNIDNEALRRMTPYLSFK